MSTPYRILAVPNEDGFGPSALLSYVVKEMLRQRQDCRVTVWNHSRKEFNENLYRSAIEQGRVEVVAVWNLIQLQKEGESGAVSIPGTLRRLGDYRIASDQYPLGSGANRFDLMVDFGVPAAARWAAARGIRSVSICDHSWAKTLEMILEDLERQPDGAGRCSEPERRQWLKLIGDIKEDEAHTRRLWLFPEFIAPEIFLRHWQQRIAPSAIRRFDGVLGGRPVWSRQQALDYLGFRDGRLLLIQGGDTPALDTLLCRLVPEFLDAARELDQLHLNVAVYVPRSSNRHPEINRLHDPRQQALSPRVRAFSPVPGGTIQELLPHVDLLVTRAGGGTVNDAIACRAPFLCAPEPTQSQVEAIHAACCRRGLTCTIPAAEPKAYILSRMQQGCQTLRSAISQLPNQAEGGLVEQIFQG